MIRYDLVPILSYYFSICRSLILPEISQISLNVVILALRIELSLIVGNINRKPLIHV
ncbi:hypothetical protein Hanom_Chr16g01445631 [Helianthus anomalus]